jgi:penicillin-binding protein 1A
MTHLMKEVVQFGTGRDAAQLGRPAAGKTGTTNDSLDAWFVGFTPEIITGVWIGYDGARSLGSGETGARAALPIWLDFMKEATKGTPSTDFEAPEGIIYVPIDPKTGRLVRVSHPGAILEAFIQGTEPKDLRDPKHRDKKIRHELLREDRE